MDSEGPIVAHQEIASRILRWPCGCMYQCAADRWLMLCDAHRPACVYTLRLSLHLNALSNKQG